MVVFYGGVKRRFLCKNLKNKTIYVNYNNCCYKHPLRKRVCIWSYSGPHFSCIFPHSDWIRRDTPNLFTQWSWRKWNGNNHKGRTIFYHSWGNRHSIFFFFFISIMLYQETQLLYHLNYAISENTVIMWTDITDSLLIALGCKHFFNTLKNWLEVGWQGKNKLRLIDVKNFYP